MLRSLCPALPLLSALLPACGQTSEGVTLRSLEASGRTSTVCLEVGRSLETNGEADYAPRDMSECPQPIGEARGELRIPFALVTQTTRGEVAVVNLEASVVDMEPTTPGFGFLPIGANPVDIVSTPGSVASFVGVAEVGKEGIFAIPSTCLRPRLDGEPVRGITSWPACRLPSAPGDMAIVVDPADDAGLVRAACGAEPAEPPEPSAAKREICPADLRQETNPPGRRKLVVALPDRHELVVIDAQALLDRPPGSFDACPIEHQVPLRVELPATVVPQELPTDLDETCRPRPSSLPPADYRARPAGFALVEDPIVDEHHLYVGDLDAPVVHVLDVRDPCAVQEEPPLLPQAFFDPSRVVTTRSIAASPLTSDQKRFLYAVDDRDARGVMVFDVSPGSVNRTPLVRPGYPVLPFEAPDRIRFDAPVQDLAFALRDTVEVSDETGNQSEGVLCDPDPDLDESEPGAQYRSSADLTTGPSPRRLRGVFAFAALDSGEISVVDVDDFDRKCRRPVGANTSEIPDFRGCALDDDEGPFLLVRDDPTSRPTVTNEASCRSVQAHRSRSRFVLRSDPDFGVASASLRARPRLVSEAGRTLVTDRSEIGRDQPRMLGVNFSASEPAQVNVGTTLFKSKEEPLDTDPPAPEEASSPQNPSSEPLDINPATAEEASLVLSLVEPRAYPAEEDFTATYEGTVLGGRPAARFEYDDDARLATLTDSGISYCEIGIEDQQLAAERGSRVGAPLERLREFGKRHADFVTLTSELPGRDDAYWNGVQDSCSFLDCRAAFGTAAVPNNRREMRVVEAYSNRFLVEPRHAEHSAERRQLNQLFECCFPGSVSYDVRASGEWIVRGSATGFRHAVTTGEGGRCVRDSCSPRANEAEGRLLEVSCATSDGSCPLDADLYPAIGPATESDIGCIVDNTTAASMRTLGSSGCIFRGLTARFVMYRGLKPSERDMQWSWHVEGAFARLALPLATISDPNSVPESMWYSNELDSLLVTDGATKGLVQVHLSSFGATSQYF